MDSTKIIELAAYTLPALITGGVAYFLFHSFFKNEENRRRFELLKENQSQALPIRLQAYERMVLFLERINPAQLLLRVSPPNTSKEDYATFLIHSIQTEFEHNLTQQVYLTSNTWDIINKAKNSTIQLIRRKSIEKEIVSAEKLREAILIEMTETESPSVIAISYLKEDLKTIF
ncbi:hypothetical protein [Flavobacterium sp.]|jgi:hypothetical protein|uniref:DUF7935 family protein n=1 Tax=Flavobacterium sp. TaxID=239 RepID=UPI002A817E8E|nr:hypothetical protein [Flavobacterium sp.]